MVSDYMRGRIVEETPEGVRVRIDDMSNMDFWLEFTVKTRADVQSTMEVNDGRHDRDQEARGEVPDVLGNRCGDVDHG
jgi:hypothetical protein